MQADAMVAPIRRLTARSRSETRMFRAHWRCEVDWVTSHPPLLDRMLLTRAPTKAPTTLAGAGPRRDVGHGHRDFGSGSVGLGRELIIVFASRQAILSQTRRRHRIVVFDSRLRSRARQWRDRRNGRANRQSRPWRLVRCRTRSNGRRCTRASTYGRCTRSRL